MKKIPSDMKKFVALLTMLMTVLISGCGSMGTTKESISEAESCERLKGIINDHPNKFDKYKKNVVIHRRYNSWRADKILASAKECQVWEWSTGLYNYTCDWKASDGEAEALANYNKANEVVKNCLGSSWQVNANTTKSGGERTVYSRQGSNTMVSVRYFTETTGWPRNWYNTLVIGDESNLQTPIQ